MKSAVRTLLCLFLCAMFMTGCSRYYARLLAQSNLGISVYEEENVTGLMTGFPTPAEKQVGLDDWLQAPQNRWSFQHVSEMLPTAQISRGTGPAAPLKRRPIVLSVLTFQDADNSPMTVYDMLRSTYTDGFIVLRKGYIISEQYFNGMRPDTKHLAATLSEALIGTLAGIAVKRGRLSPNTTVVEVVPELRASAFGSATVRQVLDMQVAVPHKQGFSDWPRLWREHLVAVGWRKGKTQASGGSYAYLRSVPKIGSHAKAFRYAPVNTDALGWIIERATNTHLPGALSRNIWSKMGAEHDAYITLDPSGSAFAAAGLCATLRDLARFGQVHLQDGFYNGRQILPAEWIAAIRSEVNQPAGQPAWLTKAFPNGRYRNHWYATGNRHGAYFSIGHFGQHLWIDPKAKVVIVKFSSTPQPFDEKMTVNAFRGFEAIADALMKH